LAIVLAGSTYYFYSRALDCKNKALECKNTAEDLGAKLQECAAGVDQLQAGAKQCQDTLAGLMQVPACAPYLQVQP
jgi:hypothetical protein